MPSLLSSHCKIQRDNKRKLTATWKFSPKMYLKFICFFPTLLPPPWSELVRAILTALPTAPIPSYLPVHSHTAAKEKPEITLWTTGLRCSPRKQMERTKKCNGRNIKNLIEECFSELKKCIQILKAHHVPGIINENQGMTRLPHFNTNFQHTAYKAMSE